MLQAKAGNLIFLGLEGMELGQLAAGGYLPVKGSSVGIADDIVLFYGKDRTEILNMLKASGMVIPDIYRGKNENV